MAGLPASNGGRENDGNSDGVEMMGTGDGGWGTGDSSVGLALAASHDKLEVVIFLIRVPITGLSATKAGCRAGSGKGD